MSVKGLLIVTLLLIAALGSGTALADRQSAVAPQESLTRTDGATVVTSDVCAGNAWTERNPHKALESELAADEFRVWVSGFGPGEVIILSVVRDASDSLIWFSGEVNAAGATELSFFLATSPPNATSNFVRYPGDGLWTLEAFGVSGRLATTPVMSVPVKCETYDAMMMDKMMMEK